MSGADQGDRGQGLPSTRLSRDRPLEDIWGDAQQERRLFAALLTSIMDPKHQSPYLEAYCVYLFVQIRSLW